MHPEECGFMVGLPVNAFDQVSVYMIIPCGFYYYNSVVHLEIRDSDKSRISLLFRITSVVLFFCLVGFCFSMILSIVLSMSAKNWIENFMGECTKSI